MTTERARPGGILLAGTLLAGLLIGAVGMFVAPASVEAEAGPLDAPSTASTYRVDTVRPRLERHPGSPTESAPSRIGRASAIAPFTTIGATYSSSSSVEGRVRVHTDEGWGRWYGLRDATGGDHGPDPGSREAATARNASDPVWVGEADGFEVSLPVDATGVRVLLVRPTGEAAPLPEAAESSGSSESAPGARPRILRREGWGARAFRGRPEFNRRLVRGVVHHTVTSNEYTADEVPSILRAIQAYHQNGRGWSDIAYNFVVDRFGRVWEARDHSYESAVVGAASSGTNLQTVAVAFLGDASTAFVPSPILRSIGMTLGWKMRRHGLRPAPTNIVGHRDVGRTACPGDVLYRQLPAIERVAIRGNPPAGPFFDVAWNRADAEAIEWSAENGVIPGLDDGRYRPGRAATRADGYTWLWRLRGSPSGSDHPFTDIPGNAAYREAVAWAADQGIARAVTGTRFGASRPMSRSDWVELLWRHLDEPAVAVTDRFTDEGPRPALSWVSAAGLIGGTTFRGDAPLTRAVGAQTLHEIRPLVDVGRLHVARAAVDWARAHAVVSGFSDHTFRPGAVLTRREAADWLWRFLDRPRSGPVDTTPGGSPLDRAAAVTWLWRAAGSPTVTLPSDYTDVAGRPQERAAAWAQDFGLFPDFPGPVFAEATPVTRSPFVRAIFRLAGRAAAWAVTPPGTVRF